MATQDNRLMDAVLLQVEQEVQFRINNPSGIDQRHAANLQLQHYRNIVQHYHKTLTPAERQTRQFLQQEIRRLTVKTNPGWQNYLLHGRLARWLNRRLLGQHKGITANRQLVEQHQNKTGIEQNLMHLTQAVKQAGFDQDISHAMQKMVAQGLPSFHIRYVDVKNPRADFVLHFNLIPGSGAYQFEKFEISQRTSACTHRFSQPEGNWHSFSPTDHGFSAGQAARLVDGRAICKEANHWIYMDKQGTIQDCVFDLTAALLALPMDKQSPTVQKALDNQLKAGACREVFLNINGTIQKHQIIAVPYQQCIKIVDPKTGIQQELHSVIDQSLQQVEKIKNIYGQKQVTELKVAHKNGVKMRS